MILVDNMHGFFSFFSQDYAHTNEHHACSTPHPLPIIKQQQQSSPLKRKRIDREETSSPPDSAIAKRRKHTGALTEPPAQSSPSKVVAGPLIAISKLPTTLARGESLDHANASALVPKTLAPVSKNDTTKEARTTRRDPKLLEYAVQKIEAHLNLEILFKHNEHRLIEQELAKCQIAQEQLRRCRLIPYPGQLGGFENADDVAAGTGLVLAPFTQPQEAAPWGVTDGPYTKHYAHWLLSDSRFDTSPELQQIEAPAAAAGKVPTRSARSSEPSARSQRRSTAAKISTSSSGRESAGPLTIKRASDGVMVKLICKFCGKDNMNSLQGFLNHCRIQHKHDYASHGAALDDCGIPLDEAELASLSITGVVDTHPSSINVVIPPNNTLLVHPLIKENRRDSITVTRPTKTQSTVPGARPRLMPPPKIPSRLCESSTSFTASPAAPRLSAFFASKGGSGDMSSLIERMKDRSDYNNILDQLQSDEEEAPPKPNSKSKNRNRGRRSTVHGGASAVRGPLTLQLPPHRLASITKEASTSTPETSSTNFRTPGPTTAATDATISPWTSNYQSAPARKVPTSDISAFTSTFGQHNTIPNSSSGYGSAVSSFTLSQPQRGTYRTSNGPRTPIDTTSREPMDISPTQTAENPGLMTDNEESRSQDEDSDVNIEVEGPSTVRIRTSVDETTVRNEKRR